MPVWLALVLLFTVTGRRFFKYSAMKYDLDVIQYYARILYGHDTDALFESIKNLTLFLPLGTALSFIYQGQLLRPLFICAVLSIAIEICQLVLRIGYFELADVLNNAIGGLFGGFLRISSKAKAAIAYSRFAAVFLSG